MPRRDTGPGQAEGAPKVVIVSPQFPPSTLAGVHRARHMAAHLPAHGWTPIVLRAAPHTYSEPGDSGLAALVRPDLIQVATPALPAGLMRRLGVGDIGLRAYPYLRAALDQILREHRPRAVFITGFPFYPMGLAGRVRRRFGVPVVLDFQDPWVSDHGAAQPTFSKAGLAHQLATWLEPRALRHAAFVTSVSEVQNRQMAARYPWLDAARMAAIPIGGDPEDFVALRSRPPTSALFALDPGLINLSYVGAFLPRAEPLARRLFQALGLLRRDHPALAARLRLNFVGTSNQPGGVGELVLPIARQAGVADLVRESPGRVPFLEALNLLANSTGLLLIGSDEPHYTASKIYPGLMSGRPFLSLFHSASSAHAILSAAGGGVALAFDDDAALAALVPAMADGLRTLAEQPQSLGRAEPAAYAAFTARAVAGQFAAIFDQVSAEAG